MSGASPCPLVELRGVVKRYGALRPLRLRELVLYPGERIALTGFDQPAAEIFVALLLGATLPEEGEIRVIGRSTATIRDETEWLTTLDRLGLVSPRAALLEVYSVAQNLAIPWTLEIDPMAPETAAKAAALAAEVGIGAELREARISEVGPEVRLRVQLGRALALEPALLVLEHPTVHLPPDAATAFGVDVARIARQRRLGVLALTNDDRFAAAVAARRLRVDPATGRLRRRWL